MPVTSGLPKPRLPFPFGERDPEADKRLFGDRRPDLHFEHFASELEAQDDGHDSGIGRSSQLFIKLLQIPMYSMLTFSLNIFSYTNCMLKTVFIFINISLLSKMCNKSFIFSRLGGCCLLHLTRKCGLSSLSSGPEGAPLTGHQELWQPQEHQHPQALEEVHQQELHRPGEPGE